jgi:hypothetical protein
MSALMTLFTLTVLALPIAVEPASGDQNTAVRLPMAEGFRAIYHDMCQLQCHPDDAACLTDCLDKATEASMSASSEEEFATCYATGGMLQSAIEPCAQSFKEAASLSLDSSIKSALEVFAGIVHRCSGAALCDGATIDEAEEMDRL